jgi:hypothetical protein
VKSAALLATLLAGCGYSTGLRLEPEYESIGVEVFGNESQMRDVERDLHVALTRVVRDRVIAPLEAPSRADLVVRGDVLEVRFRPGIRTTGNQQVESGLIVRARASLWDPGAEKLVTGPVMATTQVGYTLDSPFGEQDARRRVMENLAERLVLDLMVSHGAGDDVGAPLHPPKR